VITDDDVQAAVDYLSENSGPAAKARADRIYMEEYRKVVKATMMRENPNLSIGSQEAIAYASERYLSHLQAMRHAIEADEQHRWMMVAAEAKIEAWRTQQANYRAQGRTG